MNKKKIILVIVFAVCVIGAVLSVILINKNRNKTSLSDFTDYISGEYISDDHGIGCKVTNLGKQDVLIGTEADFTIYKNTDGNWTEYTPVYNDGEEPTHISYLTQYTLRKEGNQSINLYVPDSDKWKALEKGKYYLTFSVQLDGEDNKTIKFFFSV